MPCTWNENDSLTTKPFTFSRSHSAHLVRSCPRPKFLTVSSQLTWQSYLSTRAWRTLCSFAALSCSQCTGSNLLLHYQKGQNTFLVDWSGFKSRRPFSILNPGDPAWLEIWALPIIQELPWCFWHKNKNMWDAIFKIKPFRNKFYCRFIMASSSPLLHRILTTDYSQELPPTRSNSETSVVSLYFRYVNHFWKKWAGLTHFCSICM